MCPFVEKNYVKSYDLTFDRVLENFSSFLAVPLGRLH